MLARVLSAAVNGIEASTVELEVDSAWGDKYVAQFKIVFDAILMLKFSPAKPKREIGFHAKYVDDKARAKKR
jgi:hypothetical protein